MKMRKLQICARIIYCAVMAFWTSSVVECAVFATPSWMHTVSRNLEGRSLAAKSAEEFKKKQLAAAAAEGKVIPLAATGGAVTSVIWAIATNGAFTASSNDDKAFAQQVGILATPAMVAYAASIPGALKRKKMHELHAKHADVLYALLQDPEFKKRMGVVSWESVRRHRKKAEVVGLCTQTIGSFIVFMLYFFAIQKILKAGYDAYYAYEQGQMKPDTTGNMRNMRNFISLVWLPIMSLGAKPLITRLMRKKGGVEQLNKEFARAIAAAKAQEDLSQSVVSR
ncbi:MAG: hypothetical protein WCJ17_00040 [bacterium]